MVKFCANCGLEIKEGTKFCAGCGAQALPDAPVQTPTPTAPVVQATTTTYAATCRTSAGLCTYATTKTK